ncbi:MAG: ribonuclease H-like domain-containing protein [Chloroflexi bacterium]|nr:ribonuclease H-like domain-containing protein [Chloroflexota bacterium]
MLHHTFLHLPGVGQATERWLWEQGIATWEDFLAAPPSAPGRFNVADLAGALRQCQERSAAQDAAYFHRLLPGGERWRLFPDFPGRVAYLDIETTGVAPPHSHITLVGVYDGREYRPFVRGWNLEQLPNELRHYSLLVTYNGLRFDGPFIEAEMGPVLAHLGHLDLMYPLRRLDYRGGLKGIERQLGLDRHPDLDGLEGYDAVLLWQEYQKGNEGALDTLIRYNAEDVAALPILAAVVYNRLAEMLPLVVPALPQESQRPSLDLPYDVEMVHRLKRRRQEQSWRSLYVWGAVPE